MQGPSDNSGRIVAGARPVLQDLQTLGHCNWIFCLLRVLACWLLNLGPNGRFTEQLLESAGFDTEPKPLCEYSAQLVRSAVAELRHSPCQRVRLAGSLRPRGTETLLTAYPNLGHPLRSVSAEVLAELFPALRRALELRTPAP